MAPSSHNHNNSITDAFNEVIIRNYGHEDLAGLGDEEFEKIINIVKSIRDDSEDNWQPPHPSSDSKVWRYVNFTEIMSILERQSLWFSNFSNFEDPYEGTIPKKNLEEEIDKISSRADISRDAATNLHETYVSGNRHGQSGFVNCWNLSEYESAALWEQYIDSTDGVAIQTTVDRLEQSLSDCGRELTFGEIEYISYEDAKIPNGTLPTLYHKRLSFEHEKEFRASFLKQDDEDLGAGAYVDVDLDMLIDKLYLAPTTPDWFYNQVELVLDRYGVDCELKKSDIYSDPVY
ncbi:hypothetical protein GJR96_09395 [Haloferax sp. MBLA0076]|uniref:DUF2971 domain-containing protein n=1 Tax=Haloferax litoreum TaxID=2666140 RepID=A0A6A8GG89_9EURY|nr:MULTISPECIES: hypothetical protein [Haloferax]KAB1193640.1 hypothetical protein Hfx1148_09375 [Haloferax sp. CBA1148]MRX22168.1 hypothetical protein [Haloferax litoreum]